jgi:hypothetical protein
MSLMIRFEALNTVALISAELVKLLLRGWTADLVKQNSAGKSPSLLIKVRQATIFGGTTYLTFTCELIRRPAGK